MTPTGTIAIVFRGDRGLEPGSLRPLTPGRGLRSSFGAIEDWNRDWNPRGLANGNCDRLSGRSRIGTRRASKKLSAIPYCDRLSGRSRIGTWMQMGQRDRQKIAIVFRGDRGLEHSGGGEGGDSSSIAIVFRGDRGLEPIFYHWQFCQI